MGEMAIKRLRQLSAHEVGHTIGLSHNFISSARGENLLWIIHILISSFLIIELI